MRYLILSLLAIVAFSSCASYEYLTLNSSEMPKNDRKEFTWENDTLRLIYNFHGEGGPMNLTVYNKTNKPLFINWKKSALIQDGHATSLFNAKVQITGSISSTTPVRSKYLTTSYSDLAASFNLPLGMDLVPPSSDIKKELVAIQETGALPSLPRDSAHAEKKTDSYGVTAKFTRFSFDETQSPFQFKSYLTFVLGNNDATEFAVQHSFYAQQVLLSSDDPEYFSLYRPEGDNLYIKQRAQ
ncbi:MAG TPA: hypothetical protein VK563_05415 [Puia sp.]|nr:hypothetical protein [Puia sp.]